MYERAMLHACANTLICDNMEIAKHVSYEKGQEVKAVTLDGSMIHKSGLMTGGFDARGTGGRRWDEQEVTNLNRQREQYQNRMKELQSKRPREQHDDRLIAEINKLESSLTSDREDLAVTKNKLKDITENLKHVDEQMKDLSAQVEKVRSRLLLDMIVVELRFATPQGTAGIEERSGRLDQLKTVVARAEDEVFASFCQRIGVRNIREYESKQLKDAQAHGEVNLKLETTIARVRNQWVLSCCSTPATRAEQLFVASPPSGGPLNRSSSRASATAFRSSQSPSRQSRSSLLISRAQRRRPRQR